MSCLIIFLKDTEATSGSNIQIFRSSHQRCSKKKGVLRNFTKFTGKHLCQDEMIYCNVTKSRFVKDNSHKQFGVLEQKQGFYQEIIIDITVLQELGFEEWRLFQGMAFKIKFTNIFHQCFMKKLMQDLNRVTDIVYLTPYLLQRMIDIPPILLKRIR